MIVFLGSRGKKKVMSFLLLLVLFVCLFVWRVRKWEANVGRRWFFAGAPCRLFFCSFFRRRRRCFLASAPANAFLMASFFFVVVVVVVFVVARANGFLIASLVLGDSPSSSLPFLVRVFFSYFLFFFLKKGKTVFYGWCRGVAFGSVEVVASSHSEIRNAFSVSIFFFKKLL